MKKFRLLAIFSICIISLFALSFTGEASCADVNDDGIYSTDDAILTLKYASDIEIPDTQHFDAADVVHDGVIDTNDAVAILGIACDIYAVPQHNYSAWETVTPPTCTQTGTASCYCLICNELFYSELPKADHSYVDGSCSLCGHIAEAPYVTYNGITVNFGDDPTEVKNKLGTPQEILSDYSTSLSKIVIYVYCDDYSSLGLFTFTDNELTQFYTNNTDNIVRHGSVTYDPKISDPNKAPSQSLTSEVIITQFTDGHATDGKYVYSFLATAGESYTFANYSGRTANEKLIFHLTNGMRAIHGKTALKYCPTASSAAYKHSLDMATRGYVDHYNPEGEDPGQRLKNEGLTLLGYGENIAAGYLDAYELANGWYNSAGHRANLLNNTHEYLGIGIARLEGSPYRYYGTQNFYLSYQ